MKSCLHRQSCAHAELWRRGKVPSSGHQKHLLASVRNRLDSFRKPEVPLNQYHQQFDGTGKSIIRAVLVFQKCCVLLLIVFGTCQKLNRKVIVWGIWY